MKTFLLKYKWTIFYWLIISLIVWWLCPKQRDYYTENDLQAFENKYLFQISFWIWIVANIVFFIVFFIKLKSFKKLFPAFFGVAFYSACFLFICKDVFYDSILFINRMYKKSDVERKYVVGFISPTETSEKYFFPIDVEFNTGSFDSKLNEKLYRPGLKQNDTISLKLSKGVFGIAYYPTLFKK